VVVSVTLKNVGNVAAKEICQLYIAVPRARQQEELLPIPYHSLQGFEAVMLDPTEQQQLEFRIGREQLLTTQLDGRGVLTDGNYTVFVGGHQPGDPRGDAEGGAVLRASFAVEGGVLVPQ
jgi:beta-glucosidase